jgi:Acetyltransferase (GNAT) domain
MMDDMIMYDYHIQQKPDKQLSETVWHTIQKRSNPSPFQTSEWIFCNYDKRMTCPVLVTARLNERVVGMMLANLCQKWCGKRLFVGATGASDHDSIFVEWNGPIVETGHESCIQGMFATMMRYGGVLGKVNVPGASIELSQLFKKIPSVSCKLIEKRVVPQVILSANTHEEYMQRLSSNARSQIRRSDRAYGLLNIVRPDSIDMAHTMLERLSVFHQKRWISLGKTGAFAIPAFREFHHSLIDRCGLNGIVDLLEVSSSTGTIGLLYNLRYGTYTANYQSGFDYNVDNKNKKPGITCHHAAIKLYRDENKSVYDLLAGESRYKLSMANEIKEMEWLKLSLNPRGCIEHLIHTA